MVYPPEVVILIVQIRVALACHGYSLVDWLENVAGSSSLLFDRVEHVSMLSRLIPSKYLLFWRAILVH